MIKLTKLPTPDVLVNNGAAWTATLLAKLAAGEKPTPHENSRFRHKDIKSTLEQETHGKCAYCESKLKHIHHGDVEHIYPKSLDPAKQFEWENLTLSCEVCNQNKSNLDPLVEMIIDPYVKNPKEHICFIGALAYPAGTPDGISSIQILDLNRPELVIMRNETISRVMSIFDMLLRRDLPLVARKAILNDFKTKELSANAQYSAVINSIFDSMSIRLPADLQEA
ncbi:HNH endonuclease [Pseudomonas sp. B22(2017)]|uniref:HNH endonuclease n=1 Tax=Pseudomonas sp. B22(2017) TaxID=1981736 RepID=UPI000A1F9609|nr:HNH endonuclease [Pseudomonas sp. B22(2017)]TXI03266.1 MAG: hypothetical protein E6Q70_16155 [Pseudomonas monteilii]